MWLIARVSVMLGLLNTAAGAVVGGLLGLALFRSGGGYRAASVAAGAGVGLGSTVQRASKRS
jgi:outer membrane lipoprotein SlyB